MLAVAMMVIMDCVNTDIYQPCSNGNRNGRKQRKSEQKASTDSSVVASTSKGAKIDIVGAEKDSSGTVWYKVPVSGVALTVM